MKLLVVRGNIVYKNKEIKQGATFECDKEIAEGLLKANVVEKVTETSKKASKV